MNTDSLATNLTAAWPIVYLAMAYLTFRRRSSQEAAARYLIVYTLAAALFSLATVAMQVGWLSFVPEEVLSWLPPYFACYLAWLYIFFSTEFLGQKQSTLWSMLGGLWLGILLVVVGYSGLLPERIFEGLSWHSVIFAIILFTWLAMATRVAYLIVRAYRQATQPLYKNRIIYNGLALAFMILGDILLFSGMQVPGNSVRLVGAGIVTYVFITYHVADLLRMGLRTISFLIVTLIGIALYAAGFALSQRVFQDVPNYNSTTVVVILAVLLVLLINPLLAWVNRGVHHLVFGVSYDPGAIVREYSQGISNIVDLNRLTHVSLELISQALGIKRAILFLVEDDVEGGKNYIRLRGVGGLNVNPLPSGRLQPDNPIVDPLARDHQPLAQYDIDLLPEYKEMHPDDRDWLVALDIDLYVPICTKEKWIGLYALGPKPAAARYTPQDLNLLSTLADQTVVALQNAQLVSDLEKANREMAETAKALEKANQELRELDELKSSFIGVITHEMRTPFSNISFSIQIIERLGLERLNADQREQFEQLKNGVQTASALVNNLVTLAEFLNGQIKLSLERLTFRDILRETIVPLKKMADEKRVEFKVDLLGELLPLSADRKLLANAVYQLTHNAIKFTKPGGKVWVSCWTTAEAIYFDVKDTGVGIPADRLNSMWSEFSQMADPLKRGAEGLGLGLALVKYIIAAHGGEIWAESKEGEGSAFGFQVPLTIKPPKRPTDVFRKRPQYQRS